MHVLLLYVRACVCVWVTVIYLCILYFSVDAERDLLMAGEYGSGNITKCTRES